MSMSNSPNKQYFTVEEANSMIPMLERAFGRLHQMRLLVIESFSSLSELGCSPTEEELYAPPEDMDHDALDHLINLKLLNEALKQEIETLLEAGCLVKDIEEGLVDWPALLEGREVLLCWQAGEKAVTHWHEVDKGFDDRQRID